jgi:Caspase domain
LNRVIIAIFTLAFFSLPATAAKRVALVIGNAHYNSFSTLANPDNDAASIAQALRDAKFDEVELTNDLDFNGLKRALKIFSAQSVGAEVALIYYAGHGVEVDGVNYLVPVDAELLRATDVEFEAIPLNLARTAVSNASKLRMVVLDACRNNPFKLLTEKGTRAGRTRGLRAIETTASEFIAYSAKEGTVANDGPSDSNSPFATALVAAIKQPGVDVRLMFGKVRDDVMAATNKEQEPFTYTSLGGEAVYLHPAPIVPEVKVAPPVEPAGASIDVAWQSVKQSGNKQALEGFVAFYAEDPLFGLYGPLVQQVMAELKSEPQILASIEPQKLPLQLPEIPKPPEGFDPALVSAIQSELRRVACYAGRSDGEWGPTTLAATAEFNSLVEEKFSKLDPSTELLVALQKVKDNFCLPAPALKRDQRVVRPTLRIKKENPTPKFVVQPKERPVARQKKRSVVQQKKRKVIIPKKVASTIPIQPKTTQPKAAKSPKLNTHFALVCRLRALSGDRGTDCPAKQ